jgi:hypothetical protein
VGACAAPLLRYARSVGADAARLGARGVLMNGELRSGQAPPAAPVWLIFTGARSTPHVPFWTV